MIHLSYNANESCWRIIRLTDDVYNLSSIINGHNVKYIFPKWYRYCDVNKQNIWMMNIYHILFSKLIPLHLCVLVVTILADYTIEIITTLNGSNVLKILVDNATHQIIGFVTFFTYSVLVDLKSVTF